MKYMKITTDTNGYLTFNGISPRSLGNGLHLDVADTCNYVDKNGRIRQRTKYSDCWYVLDGGNVKEVLTSEQVIKRFGYR